MKIGFLNNKGGTGKTTFSVNLALAMSRKTETYFIDSDYAQQSGLNWLLGRGKEYKPNTWYEVNRNLKAMWCLKENLMEMIRKISNEKYVIIDGRPEPAITMQIITAGIDVVIAVVDLGEDTIRQTRDLLDFIERKRSDLPRYVIVNKVTQARISYILRKEIEEMGYEVLAIFPFSEYVKWAERDGMYIGDIRGAGRTRIPLFLDFLSSWIIKRGL